ncbi:protein FAM32A [Paroedura picta]|uniref:protein FAM32A n=1 Tax=Paroedura picta TaxID=143630 RepID=UPI004056118F
MAEYEEVQRGALRLKSGAGVAAPGKRKKKKDKDKSKIVDQTVSSKNQEEERKRTLDKRTPAQLAYEKTQEKRQMERILKKASKTHKQRVEDFNRHLDTLTEHYDIPKVSWTK